ncbi:MAG TPA: GNAT family N-acetyltransferase [Cryptosporangiaceae bacterium]|nr:GNAT family N-acetyltransferase [Cryptosporangiaceae bacterium]
MSAPEGVNLSHHTSAEAQEMLDELGEVYADAYQVEPGGEKVEAFRGRAMAAFGSANFDLVTARADGELVGFVFGYSLERSAWWDGLDPQPEPGFTEENGSRTAVLSEIEVRHAWQRQGLGRRLQEEFLRTRSEERATLATGSEVPSQHVYPRWGWTKVGLVPGRPGAYFWAYWRFIRPLRPEATE